MATEIKAHPESLALQSNSNVPIIWVLGGPGCGKGTQCALIVEKYGFVHLSTGDLLREEAASGSAKGAQLIEIMKGGGLVPNDEVLGLLEAAIRNKLGGAKGFLIDGYPREKNQGIAFEEKVAPVNLILYFECSDGTMQSRILGRAANAVEKRADDQEETIKKRLQTFRNNTEQILSQYQSKTVKINVERPVEQIFADVQSAIDQILKSVEKAQG